jgi:epoxide hydrolase 4
MEPDAELRERMVGPGPDGTRLHVVEAGPEDGPLVVLLHGFPEFWYGWRHQIGPLAAAGWRVAVPDQRGYNLSDKPRGIRAYTLDRLAGDVLAVADAAGRDRFSLVGHDWGGVVAWWLASRHPGRLDRLAILNAPHPATLSGHMRRHPTQALRSWYVAFFQLPGLPERVLSAGGFRFARRALERTSRPGTFGEEDLARYREAWGRPGALTAMLDWYRALRCPQSAAGMRVRVPTLVLWGRRDAFLDEGLAERALSLCDDGRLQAWDDAGHWIQHEQAGRVNAALTAFLSGG